MTAAALGGIAEVELGQLAARKATQADVKAFADKRTDFERSFPRSPAEAR